MTGTALFFFLFYLTWLLFSLLAQGTTRINKKAKSLDWLGIIPNYKFFCPVPTTTDYHLYYRVKGADVSWNDWEELAIGLRNPWLCFIWNPGKRDRKVFYAAVKAIRRLSNAKGKQRRKSQLLYSLLLNYVKNRVLPENAIATQFRITYQQDLNDSPNTKELFTSEICLM